MEISYLRYTPGIGLACLVFPFDQSKVGELAGREPRFCGSDEQWALCRSRAFRLRGAELQLRGTALPRGRNATKVTASECRVCARRHIKVRLACGPRHQTHQSVHSFDADDEGTIWAFVDPSTVYFLWRLRLMGRIVDLDDGTFDLDVSSFSITDQYSITYRVSNFGTPVASTHARGMNSMLRISVVDSPTQRRLVLDGALIPPWVAELRTAWMMACVRRQGRKIVLDFTNLTYISPEGELALWELMNRGVRFISGGVLTRHILQQLKRRQKKTATSCALPTSAEGKQ